VRKQTPKLLDTNLKDYAVSGPAAIGRPRESSATGFVRLVAYLHKLPSGDFDKFIEDVEAKMQAMQ